MVSWDILKQIKSFRNQLAQGVTDKSKGLLAKARQSAIREIEDDQISLKENWEIAYYLRDHSDDSIVEKIREYNIDSSKIGEANIQNQQLKTEQQLRKDQQLKRSLRLILPIAARLTELENR